MQIQQVDAFTDRAFAGNPAAVVLLEEQAPAAWMQFMAAEMNLAETAFASPEADGYRLRWFTPITEVDLCGHATLATAHVLFESGREQPGAPVRFHTASGVLTAEVDGAQIALDFPDEAPEPSPAPTEVSAILGQTPVWTGRNRMDLLVDLGEEQAVVGLSPDLAAIAALPYRALIATAPARREGADFVSRVFAPGVGIPEDPVTGSAHCCLGPYWAQRLGRDRLTGYQASSRGGTVGVEIRGDRVRLIGSAVTVFHAELTAKALPAGA